LLDFLVVCNEWEADFSGDLAIHAEDGRDLLFAEEEDLKHEMIAFFCASAHAGLAHEDDACEEDCFECHDGAEKGEGRRIEVMQVSERNGIEHHPTGEDRQVNAYEGEASCESGDGVAETFRWGATNEEVLFVFCDEVDVFLDVALGHAS
jgi:hypothetical protein